MTVHYPWRLRSNEARLDAVVCDFSTRTMVVNDGVCTTCGEVWMTETARVWFWYKYDRGLMRQSGA